MHRQYGHKTSRTNVSIRSRNSLLKQNNAESFHESANEEYFQSSVKSPVSATIYNSFSPMKKMAPTSTKNSNEYYFKGKEVFASASTARKKTSKNPSMNINTEFQTNNDSGYAKATKAVTTREAKGKSNGKLVFNADSNPTLDLASIDNGLRNNAPNSAASPKGKTQRELSLQKKNSKPSEQTYSSQTSLVKNQASLPLETSPKHRDSNADYESGSTVSGSHGRSSTKQELNWSSLKLPVDPQFVLDNFPSYLSPYEKEEIAKYSQIYYVSDIYHKIIARGEQEYEDERGDYLVVKNDHIRYRYEALEMLGRGSFGQVLKVYDHKRKEYAAVKVIRSPKKFHFQAKIEIRVLKYMMENYGADYNVIGLRDYFLFRNHVCLVFDLMDLNLYDLLKKNKFKGFPLSTVRKFAIQILYALKFLNHHKIIHCDLKPENILLKHPNKTGVKLIDFGSSCFENEKLYTYIQSRFYRSPEIILGLPYSTQIDMWSFGCLLCELYLGYPIFAGDSERDQLFNMFEVLGIPDRDLINASSRKSKFFDDDSIPLSVPNTKGKIRLANATPLASFIKEGDEKFLDLVRSCLEFDPNKRFNPDQALAHEWIIEGLPPQLQVQHLKFIQETTQNDPKQASTRNSETTTNGKNSVQPDQEANTPPSYNPESVRSARSYAGSEKTGGVNLSVRMPIQNEEKSIEREEKESPSNKQKTFFTRKLNGVQREKLSLKGITKPMLEQSSNSTRNMSSQREVTTPSNRRAHFESFYKSTKNPPETMRSPSKKGEREMSATKSNLVAWEAQSPTRKQGSIVEEKAFKAAVDPSQTKRNYQSFYSPKVSHSVERAIIKTDKDITFSATKMSLLPSLKHSVSQKAK